MSYKRVHVSELQKGQSARRLSLRGTGEFDGTYVIRPGMSEVGNCWIYSYPYGKDGDLLHKNIVRIGWSIFKEPIDEIVEVEV